MVASGKRWTKVYGRILVALDGSALAEQIVPHAQALAGKFGSTVTLLRAVSPPGTILSGSAADATMVAGPVVDPTPIVEAEEREASTYLDAIAQRLRRESIPVETEATIGPADVAIVEQARQLPADLIALTTHGRSGLSRLVFGSIAESVLRHAPCPVLLVRVVEHPTSHGSP